MGADSVGGRGLAGVHRKLESWEKAKEGVVPRAADLGARAQARGRPCALPLCRAIGGASLAANTCPGGRVRYVRNPRLSPSTSENARSTHPVRASLARALPALSAARHRAAPSVAEQVSGTILCTGTILCDGLPGILHRGTLLHPCRRPCTFVRPATLTLRDAGDQFPPRSVVTTLSTAPLVRWLRPGLGIRGKSSLFAVVLLL